ncbi:MFS transporter [Actinopolymorpha sp. B9G3]|uniref:MFS transporter n=1 Tax=Actinopolymorpha sp. B9G3 TaxID=3158970 RepID=UPI0032D903E8
MSTPSAPPRHRPGWMRALIAVVVIDMVGSGLYLPVSLLYFTKVAGISLATTGLCLSAAQLLTLPLPLLVGRLVDRFGSRAVVLCGLLLQAGGFAGFLLVSEAVTLFVAAGLAAVGQRTYWSSIFTLIADLASSADRDHAYAKSSAAQNAGVGVGALLAAALLAVGDESVFRLVIVLDAATFALSALVLWLRIPRRTHDSGPSSSAGRASVGGPLRDRPFLVLVAANTVFALCSGLLGLSLPVYVDHLLGKASWAVGVLLALNTAALALCQTVVVKRLAGRRRTRVMCVAGLGWAGWGVLMATMFAIPVEWVVVALFPVTILYTVAELLHAPASNALASELGPERERGRYMSTFQFSFALSGVVAPAFFTQLFSWQPVALWLIVCVAALAAGLAVVALESRLPVEAVAARSAESTPVG